MKKLLLFIFATMLTISTFAQLPNGSIAPDWTMTDLDGVEHNMYSYLNDGYTVVIDFSAVWCGPCWNYHVSGALEDLYINHGPAGFPGVSATTTDDVMVFFIEGDEGTIAELNGNGSTQGNWVEGTPYPIIPTVSPNNNQVTSDYAIGYWPTIYMICPNRIINENGQISTEAHYVLAQECPPLSTTVYDANILGIEYPSGLVCHSSIIPEIKLQNYGSENMTSVELTSYIDDIEQNTYVWTGDLVQYAFEIVNLPEITGLTDGPHTYTVVATNPNNQPDEDPSNNTLSEEFTANSEGKEVVLSLLTDNYPTETSWDNSLEGEVVASGGGYTQAQTLFEIPICLAPEQCYTFTVYDEYGDGMSYGGVTGNIVLTWDGTVMGEIPGDNFSYEASFEFSIIGVGTNEIESNNEFNIYPNPSTGFFNIDGAENATIAVYNTTGMLVAKYNNFNEKTIDLSKQANGIYFVRIISKNSTNTKQITISR